MSWFHIPLKSHWQMPLVSSPMAGCQKPSLHPLHPLQPPPCSAWASVATSNTDLLSCLFTCLHVGKRRCFHWWLLRKHMETEYQPEDSRCFSHCHPLPLPPTRNQLTSKLGCLKKNVLWLAFLEAESKAAQVVFCYSAWKTSQVYIIQTSKFSGFFSPLTLRRNGANIWEHDKYFCCCIAFMFEYSPIILPQMAMDAVEKGNGKFVVKSWISLLVNELGPIRGSDGYAECLTVFWRATIPSVDFLWEKTLLIGIVKKLLSPVLYFILQTAGGEGARNTSISLSRLLFQDCLVNFGEDCVGLAMYNTLPHPTLTHTCLNKEKLSQWKWGEKVHFLKQDLTRMNNVESL